MSSIKYDIKEEIGTLSSKRNGYTNKLLIASWNGGPDKYEIRTFSPEGRPLKGIRLDEEDLIALRDHLIELMKKPK